MLTGRGSPSTDLPRVSRPRSTPKVQPLITTKPRKLGATTVSRPNGSRRTTAAQPAANRSGARLAAVRTTARLPAPGVRQVISRCRAPVAEAPQCGVRDQRHSGGSRLPKVGQTPVCSHPCLLAWPEGRHKTESRGGTMFGWLCVTLGVAFGSALVPVISVEVWVLGLMASEPGARWFLVGGAVAIGQVA